jgi:hypothetical protein
VSGSLDNEEKRLREAIRQDAAGLRDAVETLQSAAARRISASHSIGQHPYAWLAGALMAGWIIGFRSK